MWMTQLFANYLQNRPLSAITIPGTHDSGCYVNSMRLARMARTQTADMAAQLAGGIRYFDLRPAIARNGTYWTYHGAPYWGDSFDNILRAIINYFTTIRAADCELVILNISHFNGEWGDDMHARFIDYLSNTLGDRLVQYTQNSATVDDNINLFNANYGQLLVNPGDRSVKSRVAILYDGAMDQRREPYLVNPALTLPRGFFLINKYVIGQAANSLTLFDQYSNASDVDEMAATQYRRLTQRGNRTIAPAQFGVNYPANPAGGAPGTLHLLSWTCTYWGRSLMTSIVDRAANDVNPRLRRFFVRDPLNPVPSWSYHPERDPKINIIYTDHFASATSNAFAGGHPDQGLGLMAMPVALAAKLNKYGAGAQAWTGWDGW
ncbi:hypothetical protein WT66_22570 [Burkholderia stagnalis]|nr:hypothetical protein WT18_17790 [Burkholderia stagnalis]KVP03553.1 hypothetical protein WT20_29275 [Burkholderia stagnalis]KVW95252.1 hypothetical protein WT30_14720 [Burkholderia stagnalis]KWH74401.1 hypothetical protein WT66_22570 [Burkholderia stagnalis]